MLTGVNLGTYNSGSHDIVDLVDALDQVPGIDRIRISSIEPTTVPDGLLDRMAAESHRLMPYLHLPLQSGVDRVLQEMRRRYSLSEYAAFVRQEAEQIPGLCLGTDIMVGHPGETNEDFEVTCRFFREQPFAYAHVFPYSERDGTPAARRTDQVRIPTRARRSAILRSLSARKRLDFHRRHLGRTVEVLFEDPKPDCWPGYTDNYVRVVLPKEASGGGSLANQIRPVRLIDTVADYVRGELADV